MQIISTGDWMMRKVRDESCSSRAKQNDLRVKILTKTYNNFTSLTILKLGGHSAKKPVQEISLFYQNEEPSLINLIFSHSVSYELHTFQFYTSLNYTEKKN